MTMRKVSWLCICIFLGGCEIIPNFNQCASPKFIGPDLERVDKYYFTEDLFHKFCPAKTPKAFTYRVTSTISLSAHIKGDWFYLKANDNLEKVDLYTKGARLSSFKDYTHVIPVNALKNNALEVTIDNKINYKMPFSIINCTCVK